MEGEQMQPEEGDGDENEDTEEEEEENETEAFQNHQLRMLPSLFGKARDSTICFEYSADLGLVRETEGTQLKECKVSYWSKWERNCVKHAFGCAGFVRTRSKTEAWTAYWGNHLKATEISNLSAFQKANHFIGSWCIGRKDRLARTLLAFRRRHGAAFNYHPEVFHFPAERKLWEQKMRSEGSVWILKPRASSCGRGIRLVHKENIQSIGKKKPAIVQRYVHNPHLINGFKYDLRIYVLVTSTDPLRVYVFRDGLARFSTKRYSMKNLNSRFAHLTNYSINCKSKDFVEPEFDEGELPAEASKWSLAAYWRHMEQAVGPEKVKSLRAEITEVIVKTCIAAEAEISPATARLNKHRGVCYELFGFDIMMDENLRPWLLEVNISPSLMGSAPLDRKIKGALLSDVFHLVGFVPSDTRTAGAEHHVQEAEASKKGGRRQDEWRRSGPQGIDLSDLSQADWAVLYDTEDEYVRRGQFERVYPTPQNCASMLALFASPRYLDVLLAKVESLSAREKARFLASGPLGPPMHPAARAEAERRRADKAAHPGKAAHAAPYSTAAGAVPAKGYHGAHGSDLASERRVLGAQPPPPPPAPSLASSQLAAQWLIPRPAARALARAPPAPHARGWPAGSLPSGALHAAAPDALFGNALARPRANSAGASIGSSVSQKSALLPPIPGTGPIFFREQLPQLSGSERRARIAP